MMKVCVLSNHMGPYHWARAAASAATDADFTYIEIAGSQEKYPWAGAVRTGAVRHICLFPKATVEFVEESEIDRRLVEALEAAGPDAVLIPGYDRRWHRQAGRWARKRLVASVLCVDSWDNAWGRRRNPVKEWVKRRLVTRLFDAAFAAGERSARYAWSLGIPYHRIWRGVDVVGNDHFAAGAQTARSEAGLRRTLDLPDDYFLYVGRLTGSKNPFGLLAAFVEYLNEGGKWHLVMVGEGVLQEQIVARSNEPPLAGRVHVRPWAAYGELPVYYGLGRCFVLPSLWDETWGLVVNEAMAAGLPVLVSSQCGCMPELCINGLNGYVLDPRDPRQMADCMLCMSNGTADLAAMGEASRRIIANWGSDAWASSVLDCVARLTNGRG